MFDDFLVAIAICYQDDFISDARILFFACCCREKEDKICGKNVKNTFKIISKLNNISNTEDIIKNDKMNRFCTKVFGTQSNDDDNNDNDRYLTIKQFHKRAKDKDESVFIQTFLQFVVLTNFDVDINQQEDGINARLRKSIDPSNINNSGPDGTRSAGVISVDMSHVDSTSKQSVPTVSSTQSHEPTLRGLR